MMGFGPTINELAERVVDGISFEVSFLYSFDLLILLFWLRCYNYHYCNYFTFT